MQQKWKYFTLGSIIVTIGVGVATTLAIAAFTIIFSANQPGCR